MEFQPVGLSPLVMLSPGSGYFRPVAIDWDTRFPPRHAARMAGRGLTPHHLDQLVTLPGVTRLRIISDILMPDWVISTFNPAGVTIEDVLTAIYKGLRVPLTQSEWECMSPMQRARIEGTFYERCQASRNFDRTRYEGVRRIDCLLHTTVFAGLSSIMLRNNEWEVVLTLSRDLGAHARTRGYP